jgi:uncharacterized protein DUF2752
MHRRHAAAAAAILVLAVLYAYDPSTTAWFPSCPFRALTGLLCPLCGSLRAAHALLHGHPVDAFVFNPFVFVSGFVWSLMPELKVAPALATAVLFTVARNLP